MKKRGHRSGSRGQGESGPGRGQPVAVRIRHQAPTARNQALHRRVECLRRRLLGAIYMTTTTVHRIDIADLHTFRLQCGHCKKISLAEVKTWTSHGGHAKCPHCENDWNAAGRAFASLMAGLRELCALDPKTPPVSIQVEVETGAEIPTS